VSVEVKNVFWTQVYVQSVALLSARLFLYVEKRKRVYDHGSIVILSGSTWRIPEMVMVLSFPMESGRDSEIASMTPTERQAVKASLQINVGEIHATNALW
jgi:hypothetical protein